MTKTERLLQARASRVVWTLLDDYLRKGNVEPDLEPVLGEMRTKLAERSEIADREDRITRERAALACVGRTDARMRRDR